MLVFLLIFPILASYGAGHDRLVFPDGMQIGDVAVGRMTSANAREAVTARAASLAAQPATVSIGGHRWGPLPAEIGLTYDLESTLNAAVSIEPSAFTRVVPFNITFDPVTFNRWLDGVLDELGGHAEDASVIIEGTRVTVRPAINGLVVDRESIVAMVREQASALAPIEISVDVDRTTPRISTEEAESAKEQVEAVLAEPYLLDFGEMRWTLAPEDVAPALRVVSLDGESLILSWDATALDRIVAEIAIDVDRPTSDAWVQELGTKSWLVPAEVGMVLDRPALVLAMQDALSRGQHSLTAPVNELVQPNLATSALMADLGMTDVVGVGTSIYAGSGPGRAHNVETAAYLIDGTLVPPGEAFSFNAAVGSLFNGLFMDAGSYIDGPSGQSLAGGVCQVSTTIFRAALDAGLPIEEWWQHTYRSPFYELGGWSAGFDAAIVQDSAVPSDSTDMRFLNPTDAWMMISAKVSPDGELRVEIHGADTGYDVDISHPVIEVAEWSTGEYSVIVDEQLPPGTREEQPPMDGLRVSFTRTVYDRNGAIVLQDTFVSTYRPYGGIVRVSPDMADLAMSGP